MIGMLLALSASCVFPLRLGKKLMHKQPITEEEGEEEENGDKDDTDDIVVMIIKVPLVTLVLFCKHSNVNHADNTSNNNHNVDVAIDMMVIVIF